MEGTHLGVIDLARAEQSVQRVVAGNGEAGDVDEEGASDVEEDEEEVQAGEAEDGVDLGHRRLLLEVVEGGVFGQLDSARVSTRASQRARDTTRCYRCCHCRRHGEDMCRWLVKEGVDVDIPPCRAATGEPGPFLVQTW